MQHKYFVFYLIIFFLTPWRAIPQEKLGLPVIAAVTSEAGPAVNAIATIFEDGRQIQALGVGNGGRINLTFSFNHDYILVLSGDNCFPKRIAISTSIPKQVLQTDHKFPPFVIEQSLFSEIKGIDKSFSDNTILRIFYDPGINNFISEVYYNDAQIKKLIENAVWRSQQVGKTADRLLKLTAEELRLMRQEYSQWIKEAGESYANAKYQDALMGYKAANRLFPDEQFPKDRIAEINDLLLALQITDNLSQVQEEKYKSLMTQAGQQFTLKKYEDSKGLYRQALSIKENDPAAIARIAEIDRLLNQLAADGEYQHFVSEADRLFKIGNLDQAGQQYTLALEKRPAESYPKQQLKEIEKLKDAQEKEATHLLRYTTALAEGDGFRDKKQYLRARESYDFALSFKPGDTIAINRIAQVDGLLKVDQDNKDYNSFVSDGDKAFARKEYQPALAAYQSAQKIKPAEVYLQQQIRATQSALENEKQKTLAEENYQSKIKEGDTSFTAADYDKARSRYSEALVVKPGEKYPTDRIAEIDKIQSNLASQKQTDELYMAKIARADQDFTAKNYQDSKSGYTEALKIKPGEVYPKQKIAEINGILDKEALTRKEFDNAIAQADRLYQNKNMAEARQAYQNAKKIIPAEKYPDEMIGKIEAYLDEQGRLAAEKQAADEARAIALVREQDQKYNTFIKQGDGQKAAKKYTEAIASYQSAMEVKPKETYPPQQIAEINGILQKEAAVQKEYDSAIAQADKLYRDKSMELAKQGYTKAQSIKPSEVYPGEMIAKIDAYFAEQNRLAAEKKAAEDAAQRTLDENYAALIKLADSQQSEKKYKEAIASYQSALEVKPKETYPPQQIAEIKNLLDKEATAQKDYDNTLTEADRLYRNKSMDEAKLAYSKAQTIKPSEKYPFEMIAKIDAYIAEQNRLAAAQKAADDAKKLAAQQELDEKYNSLVRQADKQKSEKQYADAITSYKSALGLKPQETYPSQQITEVNELIRQADAVDKKYRETVAVADKAFQTKRYPEAKNNYKSALGLKPGDAYAQNQLDKIAEFEAQAASAQQMENLYKQRIAHADELMRAEDFTKAIAEYQVALELKPGETYPTQKIAEIAKIVEARKTDAEYKRLLVAADGFFRLKQYLEARQGYSDALAIKPAEVYPANQIKAIDDILAKAKQQQESEMVVIKVQTATQDVANNEPAKKTVANDDAGIADLYAGFIKNGDQSFGDKEYNFARYYYLKALDIQPGEAYPKQKLAEIKTIIDSRLNDAKEKEYQENIDKADAALEKGELAVARAYYNRALAAKPAEKYPKGQLDFIKRKLDEIAGNTGAAEFNSLVSQGDAAFQAKDYVRARYYFFKAADLNPSESYPKQQIGRINQILGGN